MNVPMWRYIEIVKDVWIKLDAEDLERVRNRTWRLDRKRSGRIRLLTNLARSEGRTTISLERFLMAPPSGYFACQTNGQKQDDFRRSNLIVCTISQRQQRLPKRAVDSTSIYKGVSFDRESTLWRASIQLNGASLNLGSWATQEEAANAYNEAAKQNWGDLAFTNSLK